MANSIIQSDTSSCYLCGRNGNGDRLEEHHIFFGTANRKKSEKYGLTVHLCGIRCHRLGKNSAHKNKEVCRALQAEAQRIAMTHYNLSIEEFIGIFGKNHL